jgi:hypothetical protein
MIGHTTVGAGTGPNPFYVQGGQVFLTGPYRGAPFGLSVVVPAVAGPFDLGNVVVRAAIEVDPHTAQITVVSDPLPRILDGIPLAVRAVNRQHRPAQLHVQSDRLRTAVRGRVAHKHSRRKRERLKPFPGCELREPPIQTCVHRQHTGQDRQAQRREPHRQGQLPRRGGEHQIGALLAFFDEEPAMARLCILESLGAGPQALERRTRIVRALIAAVDEGRTEARLGKRPPPLTATAGA